MPTMSLAGLVKPVDFAVTFDDCAGLVGATTYEGDLA
jgi:hypothetical protein